MSTHSNARREQPSTYFVQDRTSEAELTRLTIQDRMITTLMGGVLSEQNETAALQKILDVACGTGGWLIDTAKTLPGTSLLVGVDVSKRMLTYAQTQATKQGVGNRVEFHEMDALRALDFPDMHFDLVNMRSGISFLRAWDWPKLLLEFQRLIRPGGIIRLTELTSQPQSTSPAVTQLFSMLNQAFFQAGHLLNKDGSGLVERLKYLLTQYGCQQLQVKTYTTEFRAGTPEGQAFYEDWERGFQTVRPFIQKWGGISGDYDDIFQQAIEEMHQPDFAATSQLSTLWGKKAEA